MFSRDTGSHFDWPTVLRTLGIYDTYFLLLIVNKLTPGNERVKKFFFSLQVGDTVTEQPSAENIGDIQKFLELETVEEEEADKDKTEDRTEDKDKRLREGSLEDPGSKFRIPRSPQFKKRLQNKEIVSIKGIETVKERKGVKKVKKTSFEEQLIEADKVERKKEVKRTKNKSSLKDFMITKKYAKLNVDKQGTEKMKPKLVKPATVVGKPTPVKKPETVVSSKPESSKSLGKLLCKPTSESNPTLEPKPVGELKPPEKTKTKVEYKPPLESRTPVFSKPEEKVSTELKLLAESKPVKSNPRLLADPRLKNRELKPRKPEKDGAKPGSAPTAANAVPKLLPSSSFPPPSVKPVQKPILEKHLSLPPNVHPLIEGKKPVQQRPVSRPSSSRPPASDKKPPPALQAVEFAHTEIDLERIVREPGKLGVGKHLKPVSSTGVLGITQLPRQEGPTTPAVQTALDNLPSTESLKQVLSGVQPALAGTGGPEPGAGTEQRPRDPRLHSSKQLPHKLQTKPPAPPALAQPPALTKPAVADKLQRYHLYSLNIFFGHNLRLNKMLLVICTELKY